MTTAIAAPPARAERTAARLLALAGVTARLGDGFEAGAVRVRIAGDGEGSAQALAALPELHGDVRGPPQRLPLDVASVAAGVLAAAGALAALATGVAWDVETSLLAGAVQYSTHHVAVTTGGVRVERGRHRLAPPFRTRDGVVFELEAVSYDSWRSLWSALGADDATSDAAWAAFGPRYVLGRCALPEQLHALTRSWRFAQIESLADRCGALAVRAAAASGPAPEPWVARPGQQARTRPRRVGEAPLSGVRVVELTSRLQGPLAGRLLLQLGADVLKLEPPGGDPGRHAPAGPFRAAYRAYNHGKRIRELDYREAAGRRELAELAAGADVFLHNARAGRAQRYDFDAASLARVNPGLVHVQLAGWDEGSEHAGAIAGDYVVQAGSGVAAQLGRPGAPRPSPLTLLDVLGGLLGCAAVTAGLLSHARDGRGGSLTTSLSGAAALLLGTGARDGRAADGGVPLAELTSDPRTRALFEDAGDGIAVAAPPWRFARPRRPRTGAGGSA